MSKKSKPIKLIGMSRVSIAEDGDVKISNPRKYAIVISGLTRAQAYTTKEELVRRYNNYRP